MASRVPQATAASDAGDPSTQTSTPYFPVIFDISHSLLWNLIGGRWRLGNTIGQLDLEMTNQSVAQALTGPTEIEEDLEHGMILGQDVGYESPHSMSSSHQGQTFEQGRSHATQMVFTSDHYRDVSSARVFGDRVTRQTNKSVPIERAQSVLPVCSLDQLANELLEMNRMQREEAEVAIMIGEPLMECQNGFGIVGTEAAQRHEPTVE